MSFVQLNELIRDPIVVQLGQTQPSLFDIITYNSQTVDFSEPGSTAVFFMRPILSRTPIINGASAVTLSPVDSDGHNVRYDWQADDVAIEGQYMGWWGYEFLGGSLAETPEFAIVITDHGPGYGTQTGVIVDNIAQWMPTTLNALRTDPDFGDRFLQSHADYVKRVVMGTVVTADLEYQYDPALIEYLSKKTALRLITPAKDYWARQYRQVMTQGPSESATYPDMMKALDDLHERLCRELPVDWLQLQRLLPTLPQLRVEPAPATSLGDENAWNGRRTVDPNDTQRAKLGGPHWGLFLP